LESISLAAMMRSGVVCIGRAILTHGVEGVQPPVTIYQIAFRLAEVTAVLGTSPDPGVS
jgi:hypothetical protein